MFGAYQAQGKVFLKKNPNAPKPSELFKHRHLSRRDTAIVSPTHELLGRFCVYCSEQELRKCVSGDRNPTTSGKIAVFSLTLTVRWLSIFLQD